jgi:NhaP-type Na+/H+ or K+/H+ antiporter
MEDLRREGKIRAIGVSNFSPTQMHMFSADAQLDAVQPPYNLFERAIEADMLPHAVGAGLAILSYGALCLDAAFDTSPRGLRDNAIPVASMAVVAVVLTTAAIAFLGWRFAGLPIAAAIALGAIVAPPDAVAANEVLRHLRIPQRIGLVLQGESMLNDATALLIYRAAVLAAAALPYHRVFLRQAGAAARRSALSW